MEAQRSRAQKSGTTYAFVYDNQAHVHLDVHLDVMIYCCPSTS